MRTAALLLLLILTGCGYQFAEGQLPNGIERLYLPMAVNSTTEPLLENLLSGPLTAVLARQKRVELVESAAQADAVLQTSFSHYSVEPVSYDSNDRISSFQASLKVHFALKSASDGRLIMQGDLERQESYTASVDKNQQEDLEAAALETMVKNIADDLIFRLVSRF